MPSATPNDPQLASNRSKHSRYGAVPSFDRRGGMVAAHIWRDLANDWRRWSAAERFTALGLLAIVAATPLALLTRLWRPLA